VKVSVRLLLAFFLFILPVARAEDIIVAAASDLTFAFQEVAAEFQKQTGKSVKLSFGSSGNFFSQIQNGAPYDLFFSADIGYPQKLEAQGLTEPGTLYKYAVGKIVVWVPKESGIDVSRGLLTLLDPAVRKVAIANPEHAPYGRAAVAAMQHDNVYDGVKEKLVLGENISQAAQFVESGNADAGVIALSLALAPAMKDKGRYFEIAQSSYTVLEQAGIILKSSRQKQTARKFLEFLKTPEIVELMSRYGFALPANAASPAPKENDVKRKGAQSGGR
jgi:molybdate transport system substrate-binding protein